MAEEETPQIQQIQVYHGLANPSSSTDEAAMQLLLMSRLFPKCKKPYSLAQWHYRREENSDLHLYAAMGFLPFFEYEFFRHKMERWQQEMLREEMRQMTQSDGVGEFGNSIDDETIQAQLDARPKLSNLLKRWDFDRNENLLLRLETPMKIVKNLDHALFVEGIRTNKKDSVSAVDELLCQNVDPINEAAAWAWMNRMVAGRPKAPMKMPLDCTMEALRELNEFQIYRCLADAHEYGCAPISAQRINGKLKTCLFPKRVVRVQIALEYLKDKKLVNDTLLRKVLSKKPEEREQTSLSLKRNAVSAFLTDLARAAPAEEWLNKMVYAFCRYFEPILQQVGQPQFMMGWRDVEMSKEEKCRARIVQVAFVDEKKDAVMKRTQSLPPNPSNQRS